MPELNNQQTFTQDELIQFFRERPQLTPSSFANEINQTTEFHISVRHMYYLLDKQRSLKEKYCEVLLPTMIKYGYKPNII